MKRLLVQPEPTAALRVAIVTTDSPRRAQLQEMIVAAGYEIVDSSGAADVVIVAGDAEMPDHRTVTLGLADVDQAGALPADASARQIDAAIRAVAAGLVVRVARDGVPGFDAIHERRAHPLLTPREVDILSGISAGLSNKAIARRLAISQHTVKFHVESLFKKLGVRTRAEAVAKGLERTRDETIEI